MSENPMMGDISISAEKSRVKPTNKQKCLVFAGRGISRQERHFLIDLRTLMPHSKEESKLDEKKRLSEAIPELCNLKGCNSTVFLENRKRKDLYMWLAQVPGGPSVKFLVSNLHTMDELKMTGNCLKGSRPILSFDHAFSQLPELNVLRSLLTQGRIAFRNYQIVEETDPQTKQVERSLLEIGPRFTLQPIRILNGTFEGKTVWKNEEFVNPNKLRAQVRAKASRYVEKKRAIRKRQVFVDGKGGAPEPTAVQNVFK